MDILRIATAGSVDDGKSTLIGRLLYETKSVTKDKLDAIETTSKRKGLDFVDLSLLTDGLIAEREQGITIDVAHIYFSTPTRKYIIADTPGHIEYTRNMVTGASNASVSIILIDARNGVVEQTKRHFYIAHLLRLANVIVCVNKMDLVDYSQEIFENIKSDFENFSKSLHHEGQQIAFIPVSSLYGENITTQSQEMPWYTGNHLLSTLDKIPVRQLNKSVPARFPVQYVIRPRSSNFHDYRGYAGKIASGAFAVGDNVLALPNGQQSRIKSIGKFEETLSDAYEGESVVITLTDDIDLSRGGMLVKFDEENPVKKALEAQICWFDSQSLVSGKTYLLHHGSNRVKAKIHALQNLINIQDLSISNSPAQLQLNEIGTVSIRVATPIFADKYTQNTGNGSFILIDEFSNNTVGVGFVAG